MRGRLDVGRTFKDLRDVLYTSVGYRPVGDFLSDGLSHFEKRTLDVLRVRDDRTIWRSCVV